MSDVFSPISDWSQLVHPVEVGTFRFSLCTAARAMVPGCHDEFGLSRFLSGLPGIRFSFSIAARVLFHESVPMFLTVA